jgi:probable rRNA maturation factor
MQLEKAHCFVSREWSIRCECRCFSFAESAIVRVLAFLDDLVPKKAPDGELSVAFVSLQKLRALHQKYLLDPSFTDVMTFPGDAKMSFAGEIVIAPAFALRQLVLHQTTFSEEVTLYLVHGYLHLCGLNDKTADECQEMRDAEQKCMRLLQEHGAIMECRWGSGSRKVGAGTHQVG